MKNPFEFGRELGADELVDREEEIKEVSETIRQAGKLFIIGPRRYGKTSILKVSEDKLRADGAVVLRLSAESYPSLDLLVASLIGAAAKQLKGGVERAGEQIRQFFARLRPEMSFSITMDSWSVKIGVGERGETEGHVRLLVEALDGLEELAKAQPKRRPVGLIIDEFQRIVEAGGKTTEAQIRAAIQRHSRTGYVFAGSKTRLLTAMTMDAARPFYRLGHLRFIGPVPREAFHNFLKIKFVESHFAVRSGKPDAVDLILNLAEEVPYNVQMLAHACWDALRAGGKAEENLLSEGVVHEAVDRLVRQYDPFYTQLWNNLTAIQQKTLVAVIGQSGMNMQSIKVVQALGKGSSTVRRSLDALIARDILREEEAGGSLRVRFEDPFLAHWISTFIPRL